jgi:cell division protein FtsQ
MASKTKIVRILLTTLWVSVGITVIGLLVAAVKKEEAQKCTGLNVQIKGVSNNFFVDKQDIMQAINLYIDGTPVGQPVSLLNLRSLEADVEKNIWVKSAQMFFDNNAILQVVVTEREPVARIFTSSGTTFYIDSSLAMLPLSDKFSARLPVFTNFPSDKAVLTKADSLLLKEVYEVSMEIQKNPFRMALIEQVNITAQRQFEMVPKIGNNLLMLGDGKNAAEKFEKLELFYKKVMPQTGWNKYSLVDVQYAGQVVARRKDAADIATDSLRTLQLMQTIASNAALMASDSLQRMIQDNEQNSTDVSIIQQSIQRDDEVPDAAPPAFNLAPGAAALPKAQPLNNTTPVIKTNEGVANMPAAAAKPAVTKPTVRKPAPTNKPVAKPVPAKPTPKAVMPPKNEY